MIQLSELLVPVDFSPATEWTVGEAVGYLAPENAVLVLQHVIDPEFARWADANGLGSYDAIMTKMRATAEARLQAIAEAAGAGIEVTTVVSEGVPFYEIARLAMELDVDAVVISRSGSHAGPNELFFGSTAERVVRACGRPVIVLPGRESA